MPNRVGLARSAATVDAGDHVVLPDGITVVSLVERFGDERARRETLACIEAVVGEYLARFSVQS